MCGIAGIVNLDQLPRIRAEELSAMIATMPHRGPDASGIYLADRHVGFGHVRLSIIDLSSDSNQPFIIDDGDYSITFNGEIYNYLELRRDLLARGHRFRTHSDTEVLLHAYKEWGQQVVDRLNGMWAFAIHDRKNKSVFCSRDRFGVKPFYYAEHQGRLIFASEAKAILALCPELASPDYDSLAAFARRGESPAQARTFFEKIQRLPQAHNLIIRDGKILLRRYWSYPRHLDTKISYQDARNGLYELLVDSIKLRMRSDVPVGVTLSSGVDSSTIACLLRSFHDGGLETFTSSYEEDYPTESIRAKSLAESLGMNHNAIKATASDLASNFSGIIHHLEAPMTYSAVFPYWNIMREARKKVTVMLEGQGADEVLAGYGFFARRLVDSLWAQGHYSRAASEYLWALRSEISAGVHKHSDKWSYPIWKMLHTARHLVPQVHALYRRSMMSESVYTGALRDRAEMPASGNDYGITDGLNAALVKSHEGMLADMLHYGDAISMAHSIESRLPFMDYRLVEYCFRLPGDMKFGKGQGKVILRDAVRRHVPADILDSKIKYGFSSPVTDWLRYHADEVVHPVLFSDACKSRGLFDTRKMAVLLDRHKTGKVNLVSELFRWMMIEYWFEAFIDNASSFGRAHAQSDTAVNVYGEDPIAASA